MSSTTKRDRVEKSSSSKKRKHEDTNNESKHKIKDKSSKRRKAALKVAKETDATEAENPAPAAVIEKEKEEADFVPLDTAIEGVETVSATQTKTNKKKRSKRSKETTLQAAEQVEATSPAAAEVEAGITEPEVKEDAKEAATEENERVVEEPAAKKGRFIVFIGNLPFSATKESVTAHFAKIKPSSVRHLTQKGTTKSKGYAFLEFDAYDRMLTCLKLFHHSSFEDGKSPTRKINVELTAGGGGAKSVDRKDKLRVKNEKLNEQRRRRAEEEEKQKKRKELKEAKKHGGEKGQAEAKPEEVAASEPDDGIHPSRRARIEGA